jgi:hypothetical protein
VPQREVADEEDVVRCPYRAKQLHRVRDAVAHPLQHGAFDPSQPALPVGKLLQEAEQRGLQKGERREILLVHERLHGGGMLGGERMPGAPAQVELARRDALARAEQRRQLWRR